MENLGRTAKPSFPGAEFHLIVPKNRGIPFGAGDRPKPLPNYRKFCRMNWSEERSWRKAVS
jgi:hypothetical protein